MVRKQGYLLVVLICAIVNGQAQTFGINQLISLSGKALGDQYILKERKSDNGKTYTTIYAELSNPSHTIMFTLITNIAGDTKLGSHQLQELEAFTYKDRNAIFGTIIPFIGVLQVELIGCNAVLALNETVAPDEIATKDNLLKQLEMFDILGLEKLLSDENKGNN